MECTASLDQLFGPRVDTCRRRFDFTLLFEEWVFAIIPAIVASPLIIGRIVYIARRKRIVTQHKLQYAKLTGLLLLSALQLVLLILWSTYATVKTKVSVPAASVELIISLALSILSFREHETQIQPSSITSVYLLITILLDIARTRTLWMVESATAIPIIFTISLAVRIVVLGLELKRKTKFLLGDYHDYAPEDLSGIIDRTLYWWLNDLLLAGYRRVLDLEDLAPIASIFASDDLGAKADLAWNQHQNRGKHALLIGLFSTHQWSLLAPVIPRLCTVALTCVQPLLLQELIGFLEKSQTSNIPSDFGWGLVGAYALVYLCMATSSSWYMSTMNRFLTILRGSLVSLIYEKVLRLTASGSSDSKAITLINADVERICSGLGTMHDVWANVVQIAFASWILYSQLDAAFVSPIILCSISGAITVAISRLAGPRQMSWMKKIETRIGLTTVVLNDLKGVTLSGLTNRFLTLIRDMRVDELFASAKFREMQLFSILNGYSPLILSPILAFGIFIGINLSAGRTLDTSRMFTSLAVINMITQPLSQLFQHIPTQVASVACFSRIQDFLESAEQQDKPRKLELPESIPKQNIDSPETQAQDAGKEISGPRMFSIENGSFGWAQDGQEVLKDLTLSIDRSKIHFIIGPVASGKSSLLKTILGETVKLQGSWSRYFDTAAFCEQSPWLMNTTIKQNILGCSLYQEDWYQTVIKACCLGADLEQMPEGDETKVGSKGMSLSGGQKQRLALARAVYARKDFILLDDVFSGLDAKTEHQIFHGLLGPNGLFKKSGATVVLATNSVQYSFMGDQIIMLSEDGTIQHQGTPDDFKRKGIDTGVLREAIHAADIEDLEAEKQPPKPDLGPELDETRKLGDYKLWLYYISVVGKASMAYFLFIEMSYAFMMTFPQIWLKWWADESNKHGGTYAIGKYLGVYSLLAAITYLFLEEVIRFPAMVMPVRVGKTLHMRILKTVMLAPMTIFKRHDVGSTTNRFSQDIQLIDSDLPMSLLNFAASGLIMIGQLILTVVASPYLAITIPFIFGILYLLQSFYLRTSRQLRLLDLEAKAPLVTHILETVEGIVSIRAFGWINESISRCHSLLDTSQKPYYLLNSVQRWLALVLSLMSGALAVLLVTVAVLTRHQTSAGFTAVALVSLMTLTSSMVGVVLLWTQLETALGAISRIKSFVEDTPNEGISDLTLPPPAQWPTKGEITFDRVFASYFTSTNSVLRDVSFNIKPGQKIALCGRTGSGKSSTVLALMRMISIQEGSITIDGVDLSTVDRSLLRSKLNVLPQTPLLVPGSYRLNADLLGVSSDESIRSALETVGLWGVVEAAGGLDAQLEQSLSVGQKQLFCLARAILRDCPIVVLDEATSSVDYETDRKMQEIIREKFADKTILCITHRVSTILDFDKVVVMNAGEVAEFDKPTALLERPGSIFKALYDSSGMGQRSS